MLRLFGHCPSARRQRATPHISPGAQALLYLCLLPESANAFQRFISLAAGEEAFAPPVTVSQTLLDSLGSGDAAAHFRF